MKEEEWFLELMNEVLNCLEDGLQCGIELYGDYGVHVHRTHGNNDVRLHYQALQRLWMHMIGLQVNKNQ